LNEAHWALPRFLWPGWQHPAEGASVLVTLCWGHSVTSVSVVTMMRLHVGNSFWYVLVFSTSDQLLSHSGQRELLGSTPRLLFSCGAHPIHTCAPHLFLPGNLDPSGITYQWSEMTLFPDMWVLLSTFLVAPTVKPHQPRYHEEVS
jgi:hypothetical protein